MIHFSSIHALSYRPRAEAIDEGRPLALTPDYAAYDYSKALAEREVLTGVDQGLNAVILNPVGVARMTLRHLRSARAYYKSTIVSFPVL